MYREISFSGSSESRKRSCAMIRVGDVVFDRAAKEDDALLQ